ncbi:MAG: hypothetical protein HRU49_14365 [Winogradskyella sp.]|uniref:hypothetical protein n=1 Tax=Winogradskyella sp. TaxID=1883156 RepID=UPI0025E69D8C|nr:hypothetical protein [Winogradskyella sp.]NRB84932.1 hypothetical protein [Winogradskyella sp.]
MKEKIVEYRIKDGANRLNEIIRTEIKRKTFNKRNNISGEYSDDGGFDLSNTFSMLYTEPNLGPLVKLNLKSVNSNSDGTESKLILKRKNGMTYNLHFWFAVFFIALTIVIAVYQTISNGFNRSLMIFVLPIFGLIYILLIELFADSTISNLIKRVEKIMTAEKIEYKKL